MTKAERKNQKMMDKVLADEKAGKSQKRRIKNRALQKLLNNKLSVLGIIIFVTIIIICYGAPLFTPYSPTKMDMTHTLQPPSAEHLLGTDKIGRDILARILYGGRISIFVGLGSALGAALVGVTLGAYSGYRGGIFDSIVFRISELFMSFPQMILVLLLVSMTGQRLSNLIIIFVVTGWGSVYRMTRSQVLSIREEEYVEALEAFGVPKYKIAFKHILPNAVGPIVVNITLSTAMFILQEASLSFLGLGVPMETPTWGNIINAANDFSVLTNNWWIWLPVGVMISLFVLSINFIGDGLRDSTDPSQLG